MIAVYFLQIKTIADTGCYSGLMGLVCNRTIDTVLGVFGQFAY